MDHRQIEEILEPDVRRLLEQLRGIFAFSPCLEPAVNWSAAVISLSDFGLPMTSLQGPDRQNREACFSRRPRIISFKTLSCEACGGSQDAARLMVAESLLQEDLLSFKRFEKFGQSRNDPRFVAAAQVCGVDLVLPLVLDRFVILVDELIEQSDGIERKPAFAVAGTGRGQESQVTTAPHRLRSAKGGHPPLKRTLTDNLLIHLIAPYTRLTKISP